MGHLISISELLPPRIQRTPRTQNFRLRVRISSSKPTFVFTAEFRPNFVSAAENSSSRPNFVFRAEFRVQGRISSSGPNVVFGTEFRLQDPVSSAGLNCLGRVCRSLVGRFLSGEEFRLQAEFRLRDEFRLHDRISSSVCPKPTFVFTVSSSTKASEFRLQGERNRDPLSRVNVCTHARDYRLNICKKLCVYTYVCTYKCLYLLRALLQSKVTSPHTEPQPER